MRTKQWFAAMAALLMAGCSQNEITEMNPDADTAIGFGVYTGVQTKGTETTTGTIEAAGVGFGVVALDATKANVYMTERNVTKSGGSWTYPNIAYWPADGSNLNFYSFAPYNGAGITKTAFATTTPTIGFAIQSDWNDMVDFVAAKNEDVNSPSTAVSVQFKHVLTRISFTAKTSVTLATGTTVTVTGLEFLGSNNNAGSCFYESGSYNIKDEAWSGEAAKAENYSVLTGANVGITNTPAELLGTGKYLFCIPVTSLQADKIKVKLTYTITSNGVTSTKAETVSIPASHFAKGTAYVYAFVINMKGIAFTVDSTIPAWGNGGSNDFTVNN